MCSLLVNSYFYHSDIAFASVTGSAIVVSDSAIVEVEDDNAKDDAEEDNKKEDAEEKGNEKNNLEKQEANSVDDVIKMEANDNAEVNAENERLISDDFYNSMKLFSLGIACGFLFSVLIYIISLLIEVFFKIVR